MSESKSALISEDERLSKKTTAPIGVRPPTANSLSGYAEIHKQIQRAIVSVLIWLRYYLRRRSMLLNTLRLFRSENVFIDMDKERIAMASSVDTTASRAEQFSGVWEQYQRGIEALIRSKISNRADAEDILQEVLIRTYKKLPTVKSEKSIKSWLYQVSRNAIIDYYRKSGRNKEVGTLPSDLSYEESSHDVQQALAKCVMPFIESLPDETRGVLTAIDIDGKSQKEYAEEMGIKYSTLKSRVQRGRAQLKEIFDGCCQVSRDGRGNISDFSSKKGDCGC